MKHWKVVNPELQWEGRQCAFENANGVCVYIQPGGCLDITEEDGGMVHLCSSDIEGFLEIIGYWKGFKPL